MRITVFGATGGTGRQFLRQAAADHDGTPVVRDPARITGTPGHLRAVPAADPSTPPSGSATDPVPP